MGRAGLCAALLGLATTASVARAQPATSLPTDFGTAGPPGIAGPLDGTTDYLAATPAPPWWVRGEYVFWLIGTGKLVEITKQAYNSNLFNALLDAAGKDWEDVIRTALGNDRTGFRFGIGGWLDDSQTIGVEAGFLYVDRGPLVLPLFRRNLSPLERLFGGRDVVVDVDVRQRILEALRGNVDRPLLVLLLLRRLGLIGIAEGGRQVVIPLGARDLIDGQVTFEIAEQTLWVLDLLGRTSLVAGDGFRVDGLFGYRRVYYEDNLSVRSEGTTLARPLLPGTHITSFEDIRTQNTYDGALLGVDASALYGPWTFAVRATATIAHLNAEVARAGATVVTLPDRRRLGIQGGTYLRAEDVGTFSTTTWTVIPEIGLRTGLAVTDNVLLTAGTSLLYLPETARAARQFELGLDPARTLPGRRGAPQPRTVDPPELRSAFLTTLSAGLEIRY